MQWHKAIARAGCGLTMLGIAACGLAGPAPQSAALSPPLGPTPAQDAVAPDPEYRILHQRDDRLLVELPNRLLVIVQELKAAPVVSAQVWVKTGSIYEGPHTGAGLSHFLEHLVSGGTTATRSESQSNAILGSIGAMTNAGTGLATVRYYVNTTSDHSAEAIGLLSDWMQHSTLPEAEFNRERDVIQREFQMGQGDPGRVFWKLTQQARYRFHPARHPTIGYLDEFLAISRDEVYDFYKQMYVPNNMVFAVVGDIQIRPVVDQIARLWADARPRQLPQIKFPIEPEASGPRSLSGEADIRKPRLRLAWPGTRLAQEGDYALDVLAVVLGQGESSRLVRSVRDTQRLANTISAFNLSMHWGQGFFGIDAEIAGDDGPQGEAIAKVKQAIVDQVEQIRRDGIEAQELARAQRKTMARVVFAAQTAQALASNLAENLIGMQDPDYLYHYAAAVQTVTADQVHEAARRFLDPEHLITVTLNPLPGGEAAPGLTRPEPEADPGLLSYETVDLDNGSMRQNLVAAAGVPQRAIQIDPVRRTVLPNGLRVLAGRNTALPAVAIHLYQLGGLLAEEPGREGLANATAALQMKGTASRSAETIAQLVDDLVAELRLGCGYNTHFGQALCLAEDWPVLLDLLADVTLHPSFPSDQWQKLKPRLLAAIERRQDHWNGELAEHFRRTYYRDHPWSSPIEGRRDVVADLDVTDLEAFHRDHLGGADAVLTVFGDVDPDEVIRLAQHRFGQMPPTAPKPFVAAVPPPPVAGIRHYQTQKPLAAVQVGYGPGPTRMSHEYPALRVLGRVLGDFPSGWLQQALRGTDGLAYAVWAYPYAGLAPGYFTTVFNTKPATLKEALARSLKVVRRSREELVDDQVLARAKAGVLTSEFFGKQSNSDRAQEAALAELYGMGLDEPKRFLKQVQQVDAEQLRGVANAYLKNPVVVVISHEPTADDQLDETFRQAWR